MSNHNYKATLSLLIFPLILCSCGKEKALPAINTLDSTVCPANKIAKASALEEEFPADKIARGDFLGNSPSVGLSKASAFHLSKNQDVVLTINRKCLSERKDSSGFPLTANLQPHSTGEKSSASESHNFILPDDMSLDDLAALANNDECVEMVSPNVVLKRNALPTDTYRTKQTHLAAINYNTAYDFYFTQNSSIKSDTIIAIIDDGVDITHPELKDLIWVNTAEKNGTAGVDDDKNGYKDDINGYDFASKSPNPTHKSDSSHGTHVAGLVTASTNNSSGISGLMAKNAKLMVLNVFGTSDTASTSDLDTAIRYAADMGAKFINLSLSGPGSSPSTKNALIYAVNKGVTIMVAAGNDGEVLSSSVVYMPASYGSSINGVITVGATDANPAKTGMLCSFSNRSPAYVEIGAPGCDTSNVSGGYGLLSTLKGNQYGYMMGTSMASPVATGSAAVIYSYVRDVYGKTLTPAELETLMKSGSTNYSTLDSYIADGKRVDLASLKTKLVLDYAPVVTTPVTPVDPTPTEPDTGCN